MDGSAGLDGALSPAGRDGRVGRAGMDGNDGALTAGV
jgi:hypothetical protein